MHSIVFESVHKIFRCGGFFFPRRRVETHALRGISLDISSGEVLALLGPNGSGKSTTLKLVSTVLLPDRGKVLVAGSDTRQSAQEVRARVGFALASERSIFPRLTVAENLEFFAAFENVTWRDRRERVKAVLQSVDLIGAANKQAMKLSSGMYQRMGIARALIKRPSVILLDEPTRSLDPAAAAHLWQHVRKLSREGMTILLATHNFAEAIAVADRIAILLGGEVLAVRHTAGLGLDQLRNFYLNLTGARELSWTEEVSA